MSIKPNNTSGQLAAEIYNDLLKIVRLEASAASQPATRRQQWRFKPPQRSPKTEAALRAYWGDVFKDELTALDKEWSTKHEPTPITADSLTTEEKHVSIVKAS